MHSALVRMLETPLGYAAIQACGLPTVRVYRRLLAEHLKVSARDSILDVGCGIGGFRPLFPELYTGIDINPSYISHAASRYPGRFEIMSCTDIRFPDRSFDNVFSVAMFHHLKDDEAEIAIREGMRVARNNVFHVFDSIMPVHQSGWFKRFWFGQDRGGHQRTLTQFVNLVERSASATVVKQHFGLMHDVVYIAARPKPA